MYLKIKIEYEANGKKDHYIRVLDFSTISCYKHPHLIDLYKKRKQQQSNNITSTHILNLNMAQLIMLYFIYLLLLLLFLVKPSL